MLDQKYNKAAQELGINEASIAYRSNLKKDNCDFASETFRSIKEMGDCLVLVADFKSFFDWLDHQYLKEMIAKLLGESCLPVDYYAVFKNLTRYSSWEWDSLLGLNGLAGVRGARKKLNSFNTILPRDVFHANVKNCVTQNLSSRGIPQGSPASAVLSNIYMMDFDSRINGFASQANGLYRRYCDDIIIAIPTDGKGADYAFSNWVEPIVGFIDGFEGVTLNLEKTALLHYGCTDEGVFGFTEYDLGTGHSLSKSKPLDYLGFVFDGGEIRVRARSISKYYSRLYRKCRSYATAKCSGKGVVPDEIYRTYSRRPGGRSFPNYLEKADRKVGLSDPEASAILRRGKQKIRKAINRSQRNA